MRPYAIAAGHRLTASAAEEVLRAGGTAVDATIAGALVACIAEPVLAGLLGGGFMTVVEEGGRARVLDFFVQTPKRKRPEAELDFRAIEADFGETTQEFHIGAGAVATPGLAPGLAEAHARFGRVPLRELVAPAARAAREGVRVTAFQAELNRIIAPILRATPEARALLCDAEGRPLGEGALYRNPNFAEVLEVFGIEGPRFVTEGEVAAALLAHAAEGGHLTAEDLRGYRPEWREPLEVARAGARIALNPPPALGGALVAFALELLPHQPSIVEVARAFEATTRARVEAALDEDAEAGARRLLSPRLLARYRDELAGRRPATRGTTHISIVDGDGLAVALSVSNGEGNGHILPGIGVMPNNMLGEEDLVKGGWHSWRPDRRLASIMTPTAILQPDGARAVLGSGGSNRIRSAVAQVVLGLLDWRMEPALAVDAPRLHVEAGDPPHVDFELPDLPEADRDALLAAFPQARAWARRSMFFGGVHTALVGTDGTALAAGDPRRDGVGLTSAPGAAG